MKKLTLIAGIFLALLAVIPFIRQAPLHAQEDAEAEATAPKAILENNEVMEFLFDPYYVDLRNTLRKEPEGRKTWRALYVAAYRLSEATNLLFFRDDEDYMKTQEWRDEALKARQAAVAVGKAIPSRDYDVIKPKYEALIETCNHCHQSFEIEEPTEVEVW